MANATSLDAILVNAFLDSTKTTFSMMLSTDVTLKEAKAESGYSSSGDISALIGITGDNGEGMTALSFPRELALTFVAKLIRREPDTIEAAMLNEGVGEIVNMISGSAKSTLSKTLESNYKLTVPSIVSGQGHKISGFQNTPFIVMTFNTEDGEFQVSVSFKVK